MLKVFIVIVASSAVALHAADASGSAEAARREVFLLTHQTAQTPEAKADAVRLLRGLKEKESLRLLVGMLGDRNEVVRLSACAVMLETPDLEGYFVKPLTALLWDKDARLRIAAAQALATAQVKAGAIKALAYSLTESAGANPKEPKNKDIAKVLEAYNLALERLTGKKSDNPDVRAAASFWMNFWKTNEENLLAADSKTLGTDEPPVRPQGLPKDSFDK